MGALTRTYSSFTVASLPSRIPIALEADACWSTRSRTSSWSVGSVAPYPERVGAHAPLREERPGGRRPHREHGGDRGPTLGARIAHGHTRFVTGEPRPDRVGEPRHQHEGEG